jgi:O-antigen/teichoic acid export membrane protein
MAFTHLAMSQTVVESPHAQRADNRMQRELAAARQRTRTDVVANLIGSGVTTLLQIACLPLYVRFLGVEAFGLVGFYTALQTAATVLDAAFGTTANREMAGYRADPSRIRETRDLVRTLEWAYWAAGLLAGLAIIASAPLLANHWIQAEHISQSTIVAALMLTGVVFTLQWPSGLYGGALLGLQEQIRYNVIAVATGVLRTVGSVVVLWLVSPTIEAFFIWQAIVGALQTAATAVSVWRSLHHGERARFRIAELRRVWRFTAGITGISALGLLLSQGDKVVLSKVLPLTEFGYYTLAGTVAAALYRVIIPISNAVFPRFSQLVAQKDERELARLYHQSAQAMSVIVLPLAMVLAFFASDVLALWTHNPEVVLHAHTLVVLLAIGTALNGMMTIPYMLQLAYGWTRLGVWTNTIASIVLLPAIYFAARAMGGVGSAAVWVALNSAYVLIAIPIMHRRLLVREKRTWYWSDLGAPMLAAALGAVGVRVLFIRADSPMVVAIGVALALMVSTALALCAVPWMRREAVRRLLGRHDRGRSGNVLHVT